MAMAHLGLETEGGAGGGGGRRSGGKHPPTGWLMPYGASCTNGTSECNSGQAAIVSLILDHDAHTKSTEALQAAFMAACNNEHVDVLAVLVRHGKKPGTRSLVSNRTNRFARGCLRMQL